MVINNVSRFVLSCNRSCDQVPNFSTCHRIPNEKTKNFKFFQQQSMGQRRGHRLTNSVPAVALRHTIPRTLLPDWRLFSRRRESARIRWFLEYFIFENWGGHSGFILIILNKLSTRLVAILALFPFVFFINWRRNYDFTEWFQKP